MIRAIGKEESIPFDLLLLADESIVAIEKYLSASTLYVYERDAKIIGVYALLELSIDENEIKNIAVDINHQGKGIGSELIEHAKLVSISKNKRYLLIGTGDVSTKQLKLYRSKGFVNHSVKKNFFINNYDAPLYENEKQLKDMIVLSFDLLA